MSEQVTVFESTPTPQESKMQQQRELAELLPLLVVKAASCGLAATSRQIQHVVDIIGRDIQNQRAFDERSKP